MRSSIQGLVLLLQRAVVILVITAASSLSAAELDARLIDHWRNTVHKPSINYAKDSRSRLFPDGSFQTYAKGISSGREFSEGPYNGHWSADGSVLHLEYTDGSRETYRYETDSRILVLPDQTDYRVWNRMD